MRTTPSLKARAIGLLAQREHSASELATKLLRRARADARAERNAAAASHDDDAGRDGGPAAALAVVEDDAAQTSDAMLRERVAETVAWLLEKGYLSDTRFAESRVHARATRYGSLRIRQELAQHKLTLSPDAAAALRDSEAARAAAVWSRKFGTLPADVRERAKQTRFLLGRGFTADAVRQVLSRCGARDGDEAQRAGVMGHDGESNIANDIDSHSGDPSDGA